ncbi:HK97 gp10 family phage protein [Secundilactobacillus muriivasis]
MGAFFEVDDAEFQAWAKRVEAKANPAQLKAELQTSLKRVGVQAQRTVKGRTPVDTGNLRRGWNVANAGVMAIELYNNVEYAPFVENGHRTRGGGGWVPGQFFLRDSIAEISAMMPSLITPGLTKVLEGMLD